MKMWKKTEWLGIFLSLLVAAVCRLPQLNGSFWLDEAAQALESARPFYQQLDISGDFQPPLLHLLLHLSMYFGRSEWWLRTVAALIPGLLTIFLTFKLAQSLKLKFSWIAPLLLATSSFHIFYSQELRPYSLPALWAVLSWFLLTKNHSLKLWAVVSLLGLYTSYLYPFLLFAQLFYLSLDCWRDKLSWQLSIKKLGRPLLIISLGFLPWIPSLVGQLQAGQAVKLALPGWTNVVGTPQLKSLFLVWGKFIFGVLDTEPNFWFALISLLVLLPFLLLLAKTFRLRQKTKVSHDKNLTFLLFWILLPLLLAWLVSFFIPILQPKRVLFLLPGFYLLVNYLISNNFNQLKLVTQAGKMLLLCSLLFINLFATFSYWQNPNLQRENWRELINQLKQKYLGETQTTAVFAYQAPFSPWEWYNPGFATQSLGKLSVEQVDNLATVLELGLKTPRVITFDYLTDLTDPQRKVLKEINQNGYRQTDLLNYPSIGFIRVYEK